MSEDTSFLAEAVADPRVQREVALLMMNECKGLTDSRFQPEISIAKRAFDLIKALPDVQVPVLPVWLVALHEVSCDASPLRKGWYGPEHRGTYKGSPVLLKFVQLRTNDDQEAFEKVAASWFITSHPNIVRLVGACHVGTPFFIRFRTWTKLYEASLGLLHLHDHATIHNNLKCSSIVIAADGTAKLTDLAIKSSVAPVDLEIPGSDDPRAPETVESSRNASFESDIYSLGMCILEATALNSPGFSATFGNPSFCDFSEDQHSPKQRRVCSTTCSFVYSLGKRIVDAVALVSPWNGASGESPSYRETNEVDFPLKPRSMNAELWILVNKMCSMNPHQQLKLPAVVARLQHLAEVESKMSVHRAMDLTRAVQNSQVDAVRFLIEHGVPIDKIGEGGEDGENSEDGWDSGDVEGNEDSESGTSPLSLAVCGESIEIVKILAELGAAVDVEDDEGRTPLSRAIEARNMDIARYLIQSGASVGKSSSYRASPLLQAVVVGDVGFAKFLIEHGAPIEKSTGEWESPLYVAARSGHVEMLELLFAMGATHDEDAYRGKTPLHSASSRGHSAVIRALVKHGASIHQENLIRETPVFFAAKKGRLDAARTLVELGATVDVVNHVDQTPLFAATESGCAELVPFLVEQGARVDQRDDKGQTPLIRAAKSGHLNTVKELVQLQASVDIADKKGQTPVLIASKHGHVEIVEYLVRQGADTSQRAEDGKSLLHVAARSGSTGVLEYLLGDHIIVNNEGKDDQDPSSGSTSLNRPVKSKVNRIPVDQIDEKERTALFHAVEARSMEAVSLLVEYGAALDHCDKYGETPLFCALQTAFTEAVFFLVEHGASVNHKNKDGESPLFGAVLQVDVTVIRYLVEQGADVNAEDARGRTLLFVPAGFRSVDSMELLVGLGVPVDKKNADGETALLATVERIKYHDEMFFPLYSRILFKPVEALLDLGASIGEKDLNGLTPLLIAARDDIPDLVALLVRRGAAVDDKDSSSWTPLHHAAQLGSVASAKALIKGGASIEEKDTNGRTPLFVAAESGKEEIIKYLVGCSASVDGVDASGRTLLFALAKNGLFDAGELLLSREVPLDVKDENNQTALFPAVKHGHLKFTKLLVRKGAQVDAKNVAGRTLLHIAAQFGHLDILSFLLSSSASIDEADVDLRTPLFLPAKHGHVEAMKILTHHGASVNVRDVEGKTLLFEAAGNGFLEATTFLIREGLSIHEKDLQGRPPAFCAALNSHFEIVKLLVENGASLEGQDNKGSTVLLAAIEEKRTEAVKFLLETGASVHEQDVHRKTPMAAAVQSGDCDIVQLLIQHGALIDQQSPGGRTPLFYAVAEGLMDIVKLLITHGASLVAVDASGSTPLHAAAAENQKAIVELLLAENAPLNQANLRRETPLLTAGRYGHFDLLKLLIESGASVNVQASDGETILISASRFGYLGYVQLLINSGSEGDSTTQREEAPLMLSTLTKMQQLCKATVEFQQMCKTAVKRLIDTWHQVLAQNTVEDETRVMFAKIAFRFCRFLVNWDRKSPSSRVLASRATRRLIREMHEEIDFFLATKLSTTAAGWEEKFETERQRQRRAFQAILTSPESGGGERSVQSRGRWGEASGHDLDIARAKRDALPEVAQHILARLDDVYVKLKAMRISVSDLATDKFDAIVSRFYSFYVKTRITEDSTKRVARSRQVSEGNSVLHVELDRLLAMLNVANIDNSVHQWDHLCPRDAGGDDESSLETESIGSVASRNANSVTLVVSECDARHPNYATPGSQPGYGPSSTPSWLIRYSDIHIDHNQFIAAGSFGQVCHGRWLDTPVIIKYMGYEGDPSTVSNRLLLHEIRMWFPLNHPHVIRLYGASHTGKRYFACEFASNGTLSEYLKRGNNRNLVWRKLYEAALGLKYVHDHGIVHNDLKCDNILIGAGEIAKLSDFGLSSIPDVAEIMVDKSKMGAVNWKSPEYLDGGRPTFASDIYSFAMCILEAVTAETPWGNSMKPVSVKFHVRNGRIPDKPECISNKEWRLIQQMATTDPAKRPRISYVVEMLQEFVDNAP